MASNNSIDITFCKRIAYEEWRTFQHKQDVAIAARLKVQSGTLHAGGPGRRYSVTKNATEVVASLLHPDYERYQDIKKKRLGRTNSIRHTPKTTRTAGKKIHNAIIWGRINMISFRCLNDLRGEVFKFVRSQEFPDKQITINF